MSRNSRELTTWRNGDINIGPTNLEQPFEDNDPELPSTKKHDGKFYAKVAAYTLFVMGAAAGATYYYITRRMTSGCASPEEMCLAANQGQVAVYYGQTNFDPNHPQDFVPPVMNYVSKWACSTFVCGLANLAGNLGHIVKTLNSTIPDIVVDLGTTCNDTAARDNESFAQCFVRKINHIAGSVKGVCQYHLFGRRDVFDNMKQNVTSGNFTVTRVQVQNISP